MHACNNIKATFGFCISFLNPLNGVPILFISNSAAHETYRVDVCTILNYCVRSFTILDWC